MSDLPAKVWFVPRLSRREPRYRKGFVPVTGAGYRCFAIFFVGAFGSLIAGFATPLLLRDNPIVGISLGVVIAVVGIGLSMFWFFRKVNMHTDHTTDYDAYRARKRGGA